MMETPIPGAASAPEQRVALEPVHNILNAMALLTMVERMPALPERVHAAAATLSAEQRRVNRLVFGALGGALAPEDLAAPGVEADFSAYLAALAAAPAEALRDRVGDAEAAGLPRDPAALRDLVVSHLRALWDGFLQAEWSALERELTNQANGLSSGLPQQPQITPEAIVRGLERYVAGAGRAAPLPAGVRRVVYVPSAHNGRYVTRTQYGETLRLFFSAPRYYVVLFRTTPVTQAELLGRIGALNDPTRLAVLGLFARYDKITAQRVMDELGYSQSTTSRALKHLSAFLQEGRGSDVKKTYTLIPAQLDATFDALDGIFAHPAAGAQTPEAAAEAATGLRRFLDDRERVTQWPARQKDRLLVLEYLAAKFEPRQDYSEKEVNAIISRYHTFGDPVTLRRELYDYGFLNRERDGSRYWRAEQPPAESLRRPE